MPAHLSKFVAACAAFAVADAGAHAGKGTCADAEVHCVQVWENGRWEETFKAESNLCSGECVPIHHTQPGKEDSIMYMKNHADDTHLVKFAVYSTDTCEDAGKGTYTMMSDVTQTLAGEGGKFQADSMWVMGDESKPMEDVTLVLNKCEGHVGMGTCDDGHEVMGIEFHPDDMKDWTSKFDGDMMTIKGTMDFCTGECVTAMMYTGEDEQPIMIQHQGTENTPVHFVAYSGENCMGTERTELSVGLDAVMANMGMGKFKGKFHQSNGTIVLHIGKDDHDDGKHDEHMTCGQVRDMYKMNECCGQPGKMFESDDKTRRLLSDIAGEPRIEDAVRQAMKKAQGNGGASGLKSKIMDVLKPYL